VFDTAAFALLPLEPALVLVNAAFQGAAPASLAYAVAYLLVGNVAAFLLARHQLQRHVVADAGAGTDDSPREPGRLSAWLNGRVGPIGGLALADARNWVRDPTLLLAASAPALGALSRVGLPSRTASTSQASRSNRSTRSRSRSSWVPRTSTGSSSGSSSSKTASRGR